MTQERGAEGSGGHGEGRRQRQRVASHGSAGAACHQEVAQREGRGDERRPAPLPEEERDAEEPPDLQGRTQAPPEGRGEPVQRWMRHVCELCHVEGRDGSSHDWIDDLLVNISPELLSIDERHRVDDGEHREAHDEGTQPAQCPHGPAAHVAPRIGTAWGQQMRNGNDAEPEDRGVLGANGCADRDSGPEVIPPDPVFRDPQAEQPGQCQEQDHREVHAEAVGLRDVHDGRGQQRGRKKAARAVGHALADEVDHQDGGRAHRGRDGPPHHHVGHLILNRSQVQRPEQPLVHPQHAVQQVHRERSVHEELGRRGGRLHAVAQEVGTHEHEMLVDVEVGVRRTPRQAVEAKRGGGGND